MHFKTYCVSCTQDSQWVFFMYFWHSDLLIASVSFTGLLKFEVYDSSVSVLHFGWLLAFRWSQLLSVFVLSSRCWLAFAGSLNVLFRFAGVLKVGLLHFQFFFLLLLFSISISISEFISGSSPGSIWIFSISNLINFCKSGRHRFVYGVWMSSRDGPSMQFLRTLCLPFGLLAVFESAVEILISELVELIGLRFHICV